MSKYSSPLPAVNLQSDSPGVLDGWVGRKCTRAHSVPDQVGGGWWVRVGLVPQYLIAQACEKGRSRQVSSDQPGRDRDEKDASKFSIQNHDKSRVRAGLSVSRSRSSCGVTTSMV